MWKNGTKIIYYLENNFSYFVFEIVEGRDDWRKWCDKSEENKHSFLEKNKVFSLSVTISIGFFLSLAAAISAGLFLSISHRSAKTPAETACVNTA